MRKSYSQLIKEARLAKRMTQAQLGRRMSTSAGTVSRWENGVTRPNLDQMNALSAILGIAMDALVEGGGGNLHPTPEAALYSPLVDLLRHLSPSRQRRLYDFLAAENEGGQR